MGWEKEEGVEGRRTSENCRFCVDPVSALRAEENDHGLRVPRLQPCDPVTLSI